MAWGLRASPASSSSALTPHPSTPAGTRTRTHCSSSAVISIALSASPFRLPRDLFKFKVKRAGPPTADRDDNDQHRHCDQAKHALGARRLQEEADDETGEHRADPAQRVGEADRTGANPGGKQFTLVAVKRIRQHIVR